MKKWSPRADLQKRLSFFGFALMCVVIDFIFILAWVWVHQLAEAGFEWIGDLPGMEGVVVKVLKWIFTIATLVVLVAYVIRDVVGLALRIWKTA
ncbi:hypothetical protein J7E96_04180 [Streptomyces sp. ISL-96]|uniref:hypothetical protein n=1 Tax=Streptomyces sp. ISL-96 TaxID=2819191 RepID=UPI001BE89F22|nr:hypothetical protein [Streptomyces sp. ISL-96]MBT2487743.1 hypothetical protein [Streptomyces sp. ISL-96]